MKIGVPREVKDRESRASITPAGVSQLTGEGHAVLIEASAGEGSGFSDLDYLQAGAVIAPGAAQCWAADMVVKIKEPQPSEFEHLRRGLILFTYLHLAADRAVTREMTDRGVTGIAYETVELPGGELPLLKPMSEVAGRLAVQIGAHYLEKTHGGAGKLMGGVPGVLPAHVVILGGGSVGSNAAKVALGMGAQVTVLDSNIDRLYYLEEILHDRFSTLSANAYNIAEMVKTADLLVGGVLLKGAKSPRLVTREMVAAMRPGSVIIDVSVDQGACVETIHPTTHSNPVYLVDGVIHYGVTNMPAAVPQTSTYALTNMTLPYISKLARHGMDAVRKDPALARGVNTFDGKITYRAVAEAFGLPHAALEDVL
jgi:alanine dehydrogenase